MHSADEYRVHAAECFRMATRSALPADREQWLKLANGWLKMAGEGNTIGSTGTGTIFGTRESTHPEASKIELALR